ncbi:hypothetical protein Gotur_026085 [Gossypium turneri]
MPKRKVRDLSIVQNTPNSTKTNSEQQTAIGSLNVSITPDEPTEIQTESGGTRRVRGRTVLRDLYELDPIERVKVCKNSCGQDKLKDKKVEYEAIASSDSSVHRRH